MVSPVQQPACSSIGELKESLEVNVYICTVKATFRSAVLQGAIAVVRSKYGIPTPQLEEDNLTLWARLEVSCANQSAVD